MAWSESKVLPANINDGEEIVADDQFVADDFNAAINNGLYAIRLAETNKSDLDIAETKLATIEEGAEVNIIETPKRNGVALSITSKTFDIDVPNWKEATVLTTGQDLNDLYGVDASQYYRAENGTIAMSLLNIPFASSNGCLIEIRPIRVDYNHNSYNQTIYNCIVETPFNNEIWQRSVWDNLSNGETYGDWQKMPMTAFEMPYEETTVGDALDDIISDIGDIGTALDTINGEVI